MPETEIICTEKLSLISSRAVSPASSSKVLKLAREKGGTEGGIELAGTCDPELINTE